MHLDNDAIDINGRQAGTMFQNEGFQVSQRCLKPVEEVDIGVDMLSIVANTTTDDCFAIALLADWAIHVEVRQHSKVFVMNCLECYAVSVVDGVVNLRIGIAHPWIAQKTCSLSGFRGDIGDILHRLFLQRSGLRFFGLSACTLKFGKKPAEILMFIMSTDSCHK